MLRNLLGGLFLLAAFPATTMAVAADVDWQWNDPGSSGFYNGSQTLSNGSGTSAFSRYAPGSTPNISADTVSQPPVLLIAGSNIDFDIIQAGTPINKPTCSAPKVPTIYVTAVTVCDYGIGSNIGGFRAYSDETATQFTPRLAIWVQGQGWRNIDNHPCGMVKTETMCK